MLSPHKPKKKYSQFRAPPNPSLPANDTPAACHCATQTPHGARLFAHSPTPSPALLFAARRRRLNRLCSLSTEILHVHPFPAFSASPALSPPLVFWSACEHPTNLSLAAFCHRLPSTTDPRQPGAGSAAVLAQLQCGHWHTTSPTPALSTPRLPIGPHLGPVSTGEFPSVGPEQHWVFFNLRFLLLLRDTPPISFRAPTLLSV